jgi:hypothetical protein
LPLFANFGNAYITYHISPNWQSWIIEMFEVSPINNV